MTAPLINSSDCIKRKYNKREKTHIEENSKIGLIKKEDCIFDATLKVERMTSKEKGWHIRLLKAEEVIEEKPI